ncbi:hypothetical protein C9374_012456 [Naegleria lovaniensis]|uniref:Uncharacterized protein n=1 Tax=Naegleria lovaniensis TaxID=51637 RepID=A0AA88GX62_NAELO|nr:uncharacterized protein C9374_012456 [Naegleria lovaniensis]KAG2392204.1 hypothetical protein C9374_012456 [Naegleria lovaniensis]
MSESSDNDQELPNFVDFDDVDQERKTSNMTNSSSSSGREFLESCPAFILDCSSSRNEFLSSDKNSEFKSYQSIRKVLCGSRHLFIWMDEKSSIPGASCQESNRLDDSKTLITVQHALFACGDNDYSQCGCTFQSKTKSPTIQKVDLNIPLSDCTHIPENDLKLLRQVSNQLWHLKNVYTICNYSFFHIVTTENDLQYELLVASGWNNVGCCGVGDSSGSSVTRKIVLFHYNGKQSAFLPEHEQISLVSAGGCNSILVSWNSLKRTQQVYMCGETIEHIYGNSNNFPGSVFSLDSNFVNQYIMTQHSSSDRTIIKIHAAYGSSHFLLSDCSLLSFGHFALSDPTHNRTVVEPHWIDSNQLDGESIKDFVVYESIFALLTYEGNVWVPSSNTEASKKSCTSLTVFEFGPGSISRISVSLNYDGVICQCEDNNIYLISKTPYLLEPPTSSSSFSNTKTEKVNLFHITMDRFMKRHDRMKNKSKRLLGKLSEMVLDGHADVSLHGLHGLFLVFHMNQRKERAKQQMCQKLWNQVRTSLDLPKNPFVDVWIL